MATMMRRRFRWGLGRELGARRTSCQFASDGFENLAQSALLLGRLKPKDDQNHEVERDDESKHNPRSPIGLRHEAGYGHANHHRQKQEEDPREPRAHSDRDAAIGRPADSPAN